jgi:hypothetical protein
MNSLFLGAFAIASFAADLFGQTVINTVPYIINAPGLYVLGTNLAYPYATGGAINILTSNVILDLAAITSSIRSSRPAASGSSQQTAQM